MFVPSLESWELSFSSVNRAGGGQKQKERESKYGLFVLDTQRSYYEQWPWIPRQGREQRDLKSVGWLPFHWEVGSDVFKNVPNY